MNRVMKIRPIFLLSLLTVLPLHQATQAEDKAAKPAPEKVVKGKEEVRKATVPKPAPMSNLDALFKLVPLGKTHTGVRYPVIEAGKISSMVVSERLTRLDENSLLFDNAVIDQKGTDPMTFRLQRATYSRTTDQLQSNQPAIIENKAYHIEGDSMNFDRKTNVSRLDGRVRMVIYDVAMMKAPTPAAPAETPTPAPASAPKQ